MPISAQLARLKQLSHKLIEECVQEIMKTDHPQKGALVLRLRGILEELDAVTNLRGYSAFSSRFSKILPDIERDFPDLPPIKNPFYLAELTDLQRELFSKKPTKAVRPELLKKKKRLVNAAQALGHLASRLMGFLSQEAAYFALPVSGGEKTHQDLIAALTEWGRDLNISNSVTYMSTFKSFMEIYHRVEFRASPSKDRFREELANFSRVHQAYLQVRPLISVDGGAHCFWALEDTTGLSPASFDYEHSGAADSLESAALVEAGADAPRAAIKRKASSP